MPILIALLFLLLPAVAQGAEVCTDTTDCFCDCVSGTDRGDGYVNDGCATNGVKVVTGTKAVCEDFENPDYDPDINGTAGSDSWADGSGWTPECRGCSSAWVDAYGFPGVSLWTPGAGPFTVGVGCDAGYGFGCGPPEWTGSDVFQGNTYGPDIDIQKAGQVDDEVAGLTLTSQWDGQYYNAARHGPRDCSGKLWELSISGGTEVYGVARIAFSTNLVDSGTHTDESGTCPEDADFVPRPLKFLEWGSTEDFFFFGNGQSSSDAPFNPYICSSIASEATCQTAMDGAMTVGSADCEPCGSYCSSNQCIWMYPDVSYDRSDDWALGKWALVRWHVKGLGSSSCEYHIWWWHEDAASETELIAFSGLNCSTTLLQSTLSQFSYNMFYNGGQDACEGTSLCQTAITWYVYWDNFLVGSGRAPPSAAELGWGVGGDGGGAGGSNPGLEFRGTFQGILSDAAQP